EVRDWMNLLRVLDNPLQDIPLLAVLRSPIAGFTVNELARVRMQGRGPVWQALEAASLQTDDAVLSQRCAVVVNRIRGWRRNARSLGFGQRMAALLEESGLMDHAHQQSNASDRIRRLQRLLTLVTDLERSGQGTLAE